MRKRCFILLLVLALSIACAAQTPDDRCPGGAAFRNAQTIEREISGFKVRITHGGTDSSFDLCRFEVRDHGGQVVASGTDQMVEALPEMYVLRIGTNDLVIETYSGGAHCCWTYYIVTPLPTPHVAAKIENQEQLEFLDYRGIELNDLVGRDGAFAYFELAYAFSPLPLVHLRFVQGRLRDVSPLFQSQADMEIAEERKALSPQQLERFRTRSPGPIRPDEQRTASHILSIVVDYLYSGREQQAWNELASMWPADDVERIKAKILKAREQGILRYTR